MLMSIHYQYYDLFLSIYFFILLLLYFIFIAFTRFDLSKVIFLCVINLASFLLLWHLTADLIFIINF